MCVVVVGGGCDGIYMYTFVSFGREGMGGDEKGGRLKGVCVFAHLLVRCERETRETERYKKRRVLGFGSIPPPPSPNERKREQKGKHKGGKR